MHFGARVSAARRPVEMPDGQSRTMPNPDHRASRSSEKGESIPRIATSSKGVSPQLSKVLAKALAKVSNTRFGEWCEQEAELEAELEAGVEAPTDH